ncbi:MAG TPA: Crp/Fnr family transcriptional regulator [Pyrinomonadaceae bacterium]|nr:Crp/Fnr family transcriptional regulator [Pyrinomonadaceae bacterium]
MLSHHPQVLAGNQILSALPRQQYKRLFSCLEPVHLARSKILYHLADRITHAFFLTSGMVSLLATTEGGAVTEIGMVGNEGVVGVPVALGVEKAPYQIEVQIPGRALQVKSEVLVEEFNRGGQLQDMVLRYIHFLVTQIAQSAACNRFHTNEQRLCRWLLIARDRVKSDTLHLTHEAVSHMLGATRANVTTAAINLKRAGLIDYHRGNIEIVDRQGLETAACECYRHITEVIGSFRAA